MKDFFKLKKNSVAQKCLRSVLLLVLFCGCKSLFAAAPYSLSGGSQTVCDRNAYSYCFTNRFEKAVVKAEFILSLYDSDGEPVFDSDWINVEVPLFAEPGSAVEDYLNLDQYQLPESCQTDYFYASKLWFEDGTIWQDPFGRFADW